MFFDDGSDEAERSDRRRHERITADDDDGNDDGLALATAIDSDDDQQQQQQASLTSLVPWEQPLKHALYLVLNNKIDEQWNGRYVFNTIIMYVYNEWYNRENLHHKFGVPRQLFRHKYQNICAIMDFNAFFM